MQMFAAATVPDNLEAVLGTTGPLTPAGKGKSTGGGGGGATIVPPSTAADDDDSGDSDDGSAPLTREELQAKTLRAMNRGSSGQGARGPGGRGAGRAWGRREERCGGRQEGVQTALTIRQVFNSTDSA
jgi:hypothetical protein